MHILFKKSYWKFLLKSSNQHSVHSPFVYDLITLCFYKKQEQYSKVIDTNKSFNCKENHLALLDRFLNYSKITKIYHDCDGLNSFKKIVNASETIKIVKNTQAELIYLSKDNYSLKEIIALKTGGILIVEAPYKNEEFWNILKKESFAQVVVDTYYFGFIFNRKEQAKQEFKIRL